MPRVPRGNATPRVVDFADEERDDDGRQKTCKIRENQCHRCGIRKIEFFGIGKENPVRAFFCGKCAYAFDVLRAVEI